jgi:hypothetical protein
LWLKPQKGTDKSVSFSEDISIYSANKRELFVMKSATHLKIVVTALFFGLTAMVSAADRLSFDPDASYVRAGALYNAGMKAAEAGHMDKAIGDLKSAQTLMQKISQSQPGWQPALVAYKLQKIENTLKELAASHAQLKTADDDQTVVASH